jgi:hypothetical protein
MNHGRLGRLGMKFGKSSVSSECSVVPPQRT